MANYYVILNSHGSTQLTAAQTGTGFTITQFVMGDANGQPYLPESRITATTLVHERARIAVDSVTAVNPDLVKVVVTIPPTIGGFSIHEIGLLDSTGQLVYIGNWTGAYRAAFGEGAEGQSVIELDIKTSGLGNVVIQLNPDFVAADQAWVDSLYVRKTVYNQHVIDDDAEHDHLQQQIDAEVTARGQGDANAITAAENYSHAADTALAEGMQALLDAETAARIAGDQTLQTKIGAVGATDLQTQINNINNALSGLYPKMIAAGNEAGIILSNWEFGYDAPSNINTTTLATITANLDLRQSKYMVVVNGIQKNGNIGSDDNSSYMQYPLYASPTATGFDIIKNTSMAFVGPNTDGGSLFNWQVYQLTP